MSKAQFGMIGLGTMGRNFLLNIGEHGFSGIGYNRHEDKLKLLMEEKGDLPIQGVATLPDFINGLETPRKIMLLVPAGDAVDSVIGELLEFLEPDDLVVDGGNSHFTDTERRQAFLAKRNSAGARQQVVADAAPRRKKYADESVASLREPRAHTLLFCCRCVTG